MFFTFIKPLSLGFTLLLHDKMAKINLNALRWMGQCYIWRLEIHVFFKIHNNLCKVSLSFGAFPK
jgi:hypothetical protein